MKDYQILSEAADLLERGGWCQNMPRDEKGGRCLNAAVSAITGSNGHQGYLEAWAAIQKELGYPASDLCGPIYWNNAPGRTKEEVISTIRNAKRWINQEEG